MERLILILIEHAIEDQGNSILPLDGGADAAGFQAESGEAFPQKPVAEEAGKKIAHA
jgi:hypothetical protein